MLSTEGEPSKMNIVRKNDIEEQGEKLVGKEEMGILKGGSILCNVIGHMLFGSKPLIENFLVDLKQIKERKQEKEKDLEFVSSNDILCSAFGNTTGARLLLVPINLRGKVKHFSEDDAGNYESALAFTQHD